MGTWGTNLLDNDDARDLAAAFATKSDISIVSGAFDEVIACAGQYLEAPLAQRALAAAAIVADDLEGNLPLSQTSELRPDASAVVSRILQHPSELLDLWEEADRQSDWKSEVLALQGRLRSPGPSL